MRVSGRYSLMAALLLLALFSAASVHAAVSWNVQTVDSNAAGHGNGYCPIAVDSNNNPNIAYTAVDSMKYARWNSSLGGFSAQQITPGIATDMNLDANNNPHILYEIIREGFRYASWTGLNWTIQTVDTNGGVYAALALDSQGNPHAAYSTGTALKYASRNGSTWTAETVDNGTEIPFQMSLALDSNDKPYIMYSNQDWKIATLENSGWNIKTVSLPDPASHFGNMVLDSNGNPHLIYSIGSFYDTAIKYVSWTGSSWKTQTVVSGFHLDEWNPGVLALDSLDYPHICYVSGYNVRYAVWTGADWNIQTVDPFVGARNPVYLAVDSNRIPHISYRIGSITDFTNTLMYATTTEPVPLASPLLIALPLLLLVAVIAVISAAVIMYLWRKK